MKIGISTASFFLRLNTEEALPLLAEWGVEEAEVFLSSFSEYKRSFAEQLKGSKGKVVVGSVHALGTQFEPLLYSEHPRVRADAYSVLSDFLEAGRLLGAKYYSFHCLSRTKRTYREDVPRVGSMTREVAAFCKERGITLSLENVEWAFYNHPGLFKAVKAYCPELKGVLDIKQARISGYSYEEYLEDMGQDISHVHVSDLDERGRMCLPGQGVFDFDTLFARLRDAGFTGSVLIENYGKDYGELSELKASYEFLKEKAEKY